MSAIPELLLPAGNLAKLLRAIEYGADAVYVGAGGFSLRPGAVELSIEELRRASELTGARGKRLYVALNRVLFQRDLEALESWLEATSSIPMDGIIVGDLGALSLVRTRRPELAVHISTQMSIANVEAARLLAGLGAKRVILAREASLADAAAIAEGSGLEVEVFVHGAMCVAISGRCLLSAHLAGKSGNQGECKHTCRWEWQLVEQKRPGEAIPVFEEGGRTIFLGSKDLALIEHIPAVVESGVRSVKIEGRMKSEYYVANVARVYRAALDAYAADPQGYSYRAEWMSELERVSHRPYDVGFAFGTPEDPTRLQTHNRPVSETRVMAYVRGSRAGEKLLEVTNPFTPGELLEWIAPGLEGSVTVREIVDEEGVPRSRARSSELLWVSFEEGVELPESAILRSPVQSRPLC
ncbi:MAG: peptidase U32 family protein [Myxococcota bacterium]|jgi:putative protease|nr:peptidase U32 family protein [Myxococcota bacterium]